MKIIVDENIPFAKEAFGTLGEVIISPGRAITSEIIKKTKAQALIVRSITKVGQELLNRSAVKFVGTATIGTDHIDLNYLREQKIGFSSAPGSNANSVAEYIMAALLSLAQENGFRLKDKTLGIIGVGNIGSRVVTKAQALGMKILLNDPPLARRTGDKKYQPLDEIMDADIFTLHVPLTKEGPDATYHLVDDSFLYKIKPGSILINTSRGPVVNEKSLKTATVKKHLSATVLDVWEHEPDIDTELLAIISLGTPHIAGYSFDGKVNGTFTVYESLCKHLGLLPQWKPEKALSNTQQSPLVIDNNTEKKEKVLDSLVRRLFDIREDDARLRKIAKMPVKEQNVYFDRLRKEYPIRREFQSLRVKLSHDDEDLSSTLQSLGFKIN